MVDSTSNTSNMDTSIPNPFSMSPPLNGDNYNTWYRALCMALRAKNKLGFVVRTIPAPPSTFSNHEQSV